MKPLLIEDALTQRHTSICGFFSYCKHWVSQHLNKSLLNFLLKCVFAHKTCHFRYEVENCKSNTPCFVTGKIDNSWDQFLDQQNFSNRLKKRFKIIHKRDNDLSCFVFKKDWNKWYQILRSILLRNLFSKLTNCVCHTADNMLALFTDHSQFESW